VCGECWLTLKRIRFRIGSTFLHSIRAKVALEDRSFLGHERVYFPSVLRSLRVAIRPSCYEVLWLF